jgi:hypothetical protein
MARETNADSRREFLNGLAATTSQFAILAVLCLLIPSASQAQGGGAIPEVVPKTRAVVAQFVEEFAQIRYEEDLSQQKLKDDGKVAYKQEMVFDSIIRMRYDDEGKLRVDEQRIMEKTPVHVEKRPLLNTYGFSSLAMIFHPYYESSFRFTRLENDSLQGQSLARVGFEHLPGTPTPLLYQMIGADKPMELKGTAWIDPGTGEIHRIEAEFAFEPKDKDMPVKAVRAELVYGPVVLRDEKTPRLLPVSATIDLETPRQHWRNVHRFVDYRKYRVYTSLPGVAVQ